MSIKYTLTTKRAGADAQADLPFSCKHMAVLWEIKVLAHPRHCGDTS